MSALKLSLHGHDIENVHRFKYLGSIISDDGKACSDISTRIGRASAVFQSLTAVLWNRHEISIQTKLRVYNAAVMSVLIYGAETWPMLGTDIHRLEVFQNHCLRRILGVGMRDRVPIVAIRTRSSDQPSVDALIRKRRLQLFGHVARMAPDKLPRSVFFPRPPNTWKKRRGGQSKSWNKTVLEDLSRVLPGYSIEDARLDAQNRPQWRGIVRDVMAAPKATTRSTPYQR